jgi:hypothetical protein
MLDDSEYTTQAVAALKQAVAEALERKRRLGQYAVVWRDGRPQRIIPGLRKDACVEDDTETYGTAGQDSA